MTDPAITYGNVFQSNYDSAVNYQINIEDGSAHKLDPLINLIKQLSEYIADDLQSSAPTATVEALVERLKSNERIIQINSSDARAFQTLVEDGGTANVSVHLVDVHDFEEDKLEKVLKAFWKSLQPTSVSNNVPRSGVAKFIVRESELERLHTQLQRGNLVSISAVEGMGGVGKTELAIQYTQQYASSYEGGICWLFAREFNVGTQVVGLAQSQLNLKIPEGLELPDQVAFCWRNWREGNVLLVLDDVVNYSCDVEPYLPPPACSRFKVLMTTRLKFGSPIQSLSLDVLSPEQSLELLTVLIGEARVQQELEIANALCNWLEHLPLGIELVGRYLLERTELSLSTLLFRLQEKAKQRQAIRDAALKPDEETSTSTGKRGAEAAFELSWEELDENTQHLGKLLSLFAPAPISWYLAESVEQKYCENSYMDKEFDLEKMEEARAKLLKLHLLQLSQQQEKIYRLHSLIREFFRNKLEDEYELDRAEDVADLRYETTEKSESSFSFARNHTVIQQHRSEQAEDLFQIFCQVVVSEAEKISQSPSWLEIEDIAPSIPHLEEVATVWQNNLTDDKFILPFVGLGRFHEGQGLYSKAASWYEECLSAARSRFGESHPAVAASLRNLAYLYWAQGRYSEAEPLYLQALQLNTRLLGEENSVVASNLNDLAYLYESQGRYAEAEPFYSKALALNQRALGKEHPSIASSLSNLAGLYVIQGRYTEAETLYRQALELNERVLGRNHPIVASTLNYLATLYYNQGRFDQAETLSVRSLEIRQQKLGDDHLDVATSLNNLAALYKSQGRYDEAEPLYVRALTIREQQLGSDHPDTATNLNNLAALYEAMGRYAQAESLLVRALTIREQKLGVDHPDIATSLNNLAALYESTGRYAEAEPLYMRSLAILEQTLGNQHPQVAQSLNNLAGLCKSQGRYAEAEQLYLRSLTIREQVLGDSHPDIATSLNNLAVLYAARRRFTEARLLFHRAVRISQNSLGNEHPLSKSLRKSLEAVQ